MNIISASTPETNDEIQVRSLYEQLLECWNRNDAGNFADLFVTDGNSIGFDGSQMNGRQEIRDQLSQIFAQHKVSSYIGIVRELRPLSSAVFVLRAVAGMVPPGQTQIKPEVNAIQTLIAQKQDKGFLIALFQNTPAAFHGRPELSKQLTEELQKTLDCQKNNR